MNSLSAETVNQLKNLFEEFIQPVSASKHGKQDIIKPNSGDTNNNVASNVSDNKLSIIVNKLDEILDTVTPESSDYSTLLSMKASMYYEKAKTCLKENVLDQSKEYLEKGLDLIKNHEEDPLVSFLYLRIINYLSYILSKTGELGRAKELLEKLFQDDIKCEPKVYCTEDLFFNHTVDQNTAKAKIKKLVINNMQMLGWIYGKLGLTDQYASMIHKTLQIELDVDDTDLAQWIVKCYRLASLFLTQERWENAMYHLSAAEAVLQRCDEGSATNKPLLKAQAELARIWVNYGLQLFSSSINLIKEQKEAQESNLAHDKLKKFDFTGLDITIPEVPINSITNLNEAKLLFTHTQIWLKRARFYYTLRDYPLEYVTIVLELSELYKYLAFFETTIDEKYNYHKKRYETLETLSSILQEVRPNCYLAVSIDIIKETIDVQIELMNLNLKKLYSIDQEANNEIPTDKINSEVEIEHTVLSKMNKIIDQPCIDDHREEIETKVVQLNESKIEDFNDADNQNNIKTEDMVDTVKVDLPKEENGNSFQSEKLEYHEEDKENKEEENKS